MCSSLPFAVLTHKQQVCSLYKRALRNLEAWYDRRHIYRYQAVLLRKRFDDSRCIKDLRKAQDLLKCGERELFEKRHYQPKKFQYSPGGAAFEREVIPPDWVLDFWHPLEKSQYPEYFDRREQRKKEYTEVWKKRYQDTENESGGS
ncbi:NADH dehydrogenase [ubiquinone] 1 beta subcomplex subunit 9-like [Hermetia illucens]|uniref:NADH dehydrogenase [ubiquinone] 1 beta subcomplex subunit 9-like n=1 Tax=Hermetia illucens TaxID=343691 RepID=UPI0018CC7716|nr:NADH dehydrogenase [ubiquinone] 1 beta subcomplex subunit 9-like [Hermetia illucens]